MTEGVATMAAPLARPAYKRILLKISGEALMGRSSTGCTRRPSSASPPRSTRCTGSGSRSRW